uniref:Flavin-containing monooxygenase n=1 Tax=Panagrolaimus sp. PS1159 TaxID=55785 RepID=A0AC35G4Z7_9BILA
MDDLAIKIGVMPSFISVLRQHPMLAYKWLFGPSLSYQYRLNGEHSWPDAKDAILTADTRMNPLGKSRYLKSWQLIVVILFVFYLWMHFW